jgi:hypothetical protein
LIFFLHTFAKGIFGRKKVRKDLILSERCRFELTIKIEKVFISKIAYKILGNL